MIIPCLSCGAPKDWELQRVSSVAMLMSKCPRCDGAGPWHQELVEIIRKPAGKASLWPAPTDALTSEHEPQQPNPLP
jgi:phage FluMu protein Com